MILESTKNQDATPPFFATAPFFDASEVKIGGSYKVRKIQSEVQKLLLMQTEQELIQTYKTSDMTDSMRSRIHKHRRKFFHDQEDYQETVCDHFEAYDQLERAIQKTEF